MRRLFFMSLFFVFAFSTIYAQSKISGTVKDKDTQKALSGVIVSLQGTEFSTKTDNTGKFELLNVPEGTYSLKLSFADFDNFSQKIKIGSSDVNLGEILMSENHIGGEDAIIELSNDELSGGDDDLQTNVSGILHGSRDVFLSTAGYTFGPMRFRLRGYDNKYSDLHMNGVQTNDMESGRAVWAYWGGLNDAVRNSETHKGIAEIDFGFGGIGGSTNINTRASQIRVGTKFTYSFTNRNYYHRAMFLHSTGMMENGWAFAFSGSKRYAEEGYTEGTFYDAYAYFAAAEKKFNDKHSIGIVAFGSPSKRGGRSATTQEVYDLTSGLYNGHKKYNPNWGWQDGEKRNAKITDSHTPMFIFTHYWDIDNSSKLQTSLSYSRGKYNKTSLNWYEGADPRPDYYRYLPSYMTGEDAITRRTEEFQNGERQIDWDAMYQANYTSFDTIYDADGIVGNTLTGRKSQFIVEDRRNENNQFQFNSVYKKMLNDNFKVTAGIQHRYYKARHYKTLLDLLGGEFIVDIDKYASRDLAGEGVDFNDIRYPNNIIDEVGEVFGNDYYATVNYSELWAQASYSLNKFDFYFTGNGSYTNFWRTGNMQNGKFPDNSFGDSEKPAFINYGVKFGSTYKISGMHFLHADAAYLTKAPDFRNAFVSPRTRNQIVDGLTSETILSAQGGYVLQSSKLKATLDVFYTEFKDQTEVRSFYFDEYNNFVNFVMTGINKTHQGIELGAEYTILPGLSVYGVGSLGYYRWTSRPSFSIYVDNSAEVQYNKETVYAEGFLIGGTPQTAYSAGFKYFAPKYWRVGVSANYLADRYLSFSALTRTVDAVKYTDHSTDEYTALIEQDRLPDSFTVDAFIGKSFRFDYKYYLNISLNVTNILNNTDIITGGYEQARLDLGNYDKFPPKYYYFSGLQYYLNINFRF
ncbi:MAG: TonB-dependent receptor [Bacteroidales bacterium]|nr:TonB-dependent receptor [Bacteroidales bacterium]